MYENSTNLYNLIVVTFDKEEYVCLSSEDKEEVESAYVQASQILTDVNNKADYLGVFDYTFNKGIILLTK